MYDRIADLKVWLTERSRRENWLIFILGLTIVYLSARFIFIRPIINKQKATLTAIKNIKEQTARIQNETNKIFQLIKTPAFLNLLNKQKQLSFKATTMQKQLTEIQPVFIDITQLPAISKDILKQQTSQINLMSLKALPSTKWSLEEAKFINPLGKDIYQHGMQLEFRSTYFNTIAYLIRLERLNWRLYWDSLTYKVTEYPTGNVVLQLHSLSDQNK